MSQEKKITRAVCAQLPVWIEQTARPVMDDALAASGLQADLSLAGQERDKLIIAYPAVKTSTVYVSATVQLQFGAGATGEPHQFHPVDCDIAPWIEDVSFPTARPQVLTPNDVHHPQEQASEAPLSTVGCMRGLGGPALLSCRPNSQASKDGTHDIPLDSQPAGATSKPLGQSGSRQYDAQIDGETDGDLR